MTAIDKPALSLGVSAQSFPIGSVDARMITVMRCILALSALVIIALDPSEPGRLVVLTYGTVLVYLLWSVVSMVLATRRPPQPLPPRHEHWIDVGFSAFLAGLTLGAGSVYFFVFLFAILVASFTRGFREGLRVTVASTLLFQVAVYAFPASAVQNDMDRILVRPFYLLALGFMIAYWGGNEVLHRRRLRLLQEINNQWNPRFGHDHAVGTNLERTLEFFSGGACVLVLKRPTTPPIYLTYHTAGRKPGQAMAPSAITPETATLLLSFPPGTALRYEEHMPAWRRVFSAGRLTREGAMAERCKVLANLLDTTSFMTVPYEQRDGTEGRVYLTVGRRHFGQADLDFFAQLMTTVSNVVEGMQLMDELVSRAAEHERYRISLDIHDTTIQPYIGLKLGLDAVAREAGADNPIAPRLAELVGMTEATVRDLRRYMTRLQDDSTLAGDSLVSAVRDQASHYHRFYGIEVELRCEADLVVSSQLAGAALQIVSEGLSNILRHSQAKQAYVALRNEGHRLLIEIANEAAPAAPLPEFTPRSIAARTRSMGGTCVVERDPLGYTIVRVIIPL